MTNATKEHRAADVRGKTIRLAWTDGPTKGRAYDHVFHEDGSVEWRDADAPQEAATQADGASSDSAGNGGAATTATNKPRVEYAAVRITDDVCLVSYQSNEGYTLTVALNFDDNGITGFASGAKEWHPVRGTFTVVA
jgi:hypothetical protein